MFSLINSYKEGTLNHLNFVISLMTRLKIWVHLILLSLFSILLLNIALFINVYSGWWNIYNSKLLFLHDGKTDKNIFYVLYIFDISINSFFLHMLWQNCIFGTMCTFSGKCIRLPLHLANVLLGVNLIHNTMIFWKLRVHCTLFEHITC